MFTIQEQKNGEIINIELHKTKPHLYDVKFMYDFRRYNGGIDFSGSTEEFKNLTDYLKSKGFGFIEWKQNVPDAFIIKTNPFSDKLGRLYGTYLDMEDITESEYLERKYNQLKKSSTFNQIILDLARIYKYKPNPIFTLQTLLELTLGDINKNIGTDKKTYLIIEVLKSKQYNNVKKLCELGADINLLDYRDDSLLHWAAYYENKDLYDYLIEKGCKFIHAKNYENKKPYEYFGNTLKLEYHNLYAEQEAKPNVETKVETKVEPNVEQPKISMKEELEARYNLRVKFYDLKQRELATKRSSKKLLEKDLKLQRFKMEQDIEKFKMEDSENHLQDKIIIEREQGNNFEDFELIE